MSVPVEIERDGAVAVIRMRGPSGNALNEALVGELRRAADSLRDDPRTRAVVLASADERFFSVGLDLVGLSKADADTGYRLLNSFTALYRELYLFPRPLLAVLTGHALAGGAILALAADFRIAREGDWTMGITEVALGVPTPPGIYEIVVEAAGPASARRIVFLGEAFGAKEARKIGLLDRLEPAATFEEAWRGFASELAAKPTTAYHRLKVDRRGPTADAMTDPSRMRGFVDCWFSEESKRLREAVVERLLSRKKK